MGAPGEWASNRWFVPVSRQGGMGRKGERREKRYAIYAIDKAMQGSDARQTKTRLSMTNVRAGDDGGLETKKG